MMQPADATVRTDSVAAVDAAIEERRSVRAFLPTPVPRATIEDILRVASRAPSGTNMQPWEVIVLTGEAKAALSRALLAVHDDPVAVQGHRHEKRYYPEPWPEPWLGRRRKLGWALYGLLGIARENRAGMQHQHGRNLDFFDAPVGMIFTISRRLELGSWLDYGGFLQNIAVAAQARGLGTCIQAAFAPLHAVVRAQLGLPDDAMIVCGMSLGYADPARPENTLRSEREPVHAFAAFRD